MPRKKKPKNYLSLRTACTRTAKLLECPYKDVAVLMRKALGEVFSGGCDGFNDKIISFNGNNSDVVDLTAVGSGVSRKRKRGAMLSVQLIRYKRVENGKSEPCERIRIIQRRGGDYTKFLAQQDIRSDDRKIL